MKFEHLKEKIAFNKPQYMSSLMIFIGVLLVMTTLNSNDIQNESTSDNTIKFEGGFVRTGFISNIVFDQDYEIKTSDIIAIKEEFTVKLKKPVNIYQMGTRKGIYMHTSDVFGVGEFDKEGNIMASENGLISGNKIIYPYR